jgi:6-pyruvoyltetrahydropterin/6-carboxytetrahydropterin synthase
MPHEICKEFTFDAAHKLPHHEGACKNLHGHTYKVAVRVRRDLQETGSAQGMVVDFGELKKAWAKVHSDLDHAYLNDLMPNPTAEVLAEKIFRRMEFMVDGISSVTVWETPTSSATFWED